MATWPTSIPQDFEDKGFFDEMPEQLLRSELKGEEKTRRRARREKTREIRGNMLMTNNEWITLKSFYDVDLLAGTIDFDFPDPHDSTNTITVNFRDPPSLTAIGGQLNRVSISLIGG